MACLIYSLVDYNSWVETKEGLALAATLDKDVVLAEGNSSPHRALRIN